MVKGSELSLLWLKFNTWLGNFCMLWARPKKLKKNKIKTTYTRRMKYVLSHTHNILLEEIKDVFYKRESKFSLVYSSVI